MDKVNSMQVEMENGTRKAGISKKEPKSAKYWKRKQDTFDMPIISVAMTGKKLNLR